MPRQPRSWTLTRIGRQEHSKAVDLVFRRTRQVQWHETDAAGIAHFTAFLKYMEETEHALLADRGVGVHLEDAGRTISFPRVSVGCDFRASLRFHETCEIEARVDKLGEKSITYAFDFRKDGTVIAHGHITAVCCVIRDGVPPEAIAIPEWFRERLGEHSG